MNGYGPVDFHSHLVPDVDDGARGLEGALAAVERMVDAGFTKIITTPHLDGSLQDEPEAMAERVEEVRAAFDEVRTAATDRWPWLEMRLGFEVMLDQPEIDFRDERLRLAGTRFILVEWPRLQIPPGTERVVQRMLDAGLRPVIAHPERYGGMDQMPHLAGRWVEMGALLQVNWGSLVGRYGPAARKIARRLLREGLVSYFASDFHGREHLALNYTESKAVMEEWGAAEAFRVLTETNPRRLWEDTEPMPVPLLAEEEGLVARFKRFIGADS